jgi:hypothetical protein
MNLTTIKFRGKRIDNNEWWHGDLITDSDISIKQTFRTYIHNPVKHIKPIDGLKSSEVLLYEVIPETVGQFTTFLDKHNCEIYADDITQTFYDDGSKGDIGCWVFEGGMWMLEVYRNSELIKFPFYFYAGNGFEIIGNKFDNPDLLK